MRTLAAVLAVQGWQWPVPPLHAVMASAAGVARSGRRSRSVLAGHHTGVPAATWSALDLLIFGSGPGCQPESRTPGVSVQIDLLGAAGIREPGIDADRRGSGVRSTGAHRSATIEGGGMTVVAAEVAETAWVDADSTAWIRMPTSGS